MTRIFFLCPDYAPPSGGIRKLYRQVDVLNSKGFHASLVHTRIGFRCTWFENTTQVVYASEVRFGPSDFVVIPEITGPAAASIAPGIRKVVFNQNAYFTFRGYSADPSISGLRTPALRLSPPSRFPRTTDSIWRTLFPVSRCSASGTGSTRSCFFSADRSAEHCFHAPKKCRRHNSGHY